MLIDTSGFPASGDDPKVENTDLSLFSHGDLV